MEWSGCRRARAYARNGDFYRRYDAKNGKPVPDGAIPCQENPDPVTGHFPCWVICDRTAKGDVWYWAAYDNSNVKEDAAYEAVWPHFHCNPYNLQRDTLIRHWMDIVDVEHSFDGIRQFLYDHYIDGIVLWKDGDTQCKIKRKDFGFSWDANQNHASWKFNIVIFHFEFKNLEMFF